MAKLIIKLINSTAQLIDRRPADPRPAQSAVLCPISTSRTAMRSIRRPTCRSRFPPQAKRRRARNMKFAFNGADYRHARRRECRDPRSGWRGVFLPVRAHGRRSKPGGPRAIGRGNLPAGRGIARGDRAVVIAGLVRTRLRFVSTAGASLAQPRRRTWCWPIIEPISSARTGRACISATRPGGHRLRSATSARWASSHPIEPIREYCREIWKAEPFPIALDA